MFTQVATRTIEEPLRIGSEGLELSGMLHHPSDDGPVRGAVLVCPTDGEERAWTLRTLVTFARLAAKRGYWALRFDYAGQGESDGAYEQTTVSERIANIGAALTALRARSGVAEPAVVGTRLGAALALEAAARDSAVTRMALWEPVVAIDPYVTNLVRVNLTSQMVIHKKVVRPTEELLEDLKRGGTVSANGYQLTSTLLDGLSMLRPAERLTSFGGSLLVVTGPATRLPESRAEVSKLTFLPFWKEPKADMTPPQAVLTLTADWLDRAAGAGER